MKNLLFASFFLLFLPCFTQAQSYERYKVWGDTTLVSEHLGYEKEITVTVPLEWQADMDYEFPLIIVFDRQNERSHQFMLNTIDYLTSNEQMPSAVVLSVRSTEGKRYLETLLPQSDPKGLGVANEGFIFEELIPLAEQKLKAGKFRLLIGHSRYGFYTSYLFHKRLDDLNAVIALSPFFGQRNLNLVETFQGLGTVTPEHYRYYRFGIGGDYPADFKAMAAVLKQMNEPKLDMEGVLFPQADHNVTPGLMIATALYDVFEFWAQQQNGFFDVSNNELGKIITIRENLKRHYGASISFGLGYLNGKGWQFYNAEKYDLAISAWKLMLEAYPNFSEGYLYIARAERRLQRDVSKTLSLFRENLDRSDFYTPEEKEELLQEIE